MIDATSWIAVYPEIVLLVMTCVVLLADLTVKSPQRTATHVMSLLTLGVTAYMHISYALEGNNTYAFANMVVSDSMGHWLKAFAAIAVGVTLIYARPYAQPRGMMLGGEMYSLSLFALLGMNVMISGNNFLVIYVGLELLTLSSYALVALRRDHATSTEAAMKYFVLGALASGFLLYGLSMMYGATGSLDISTVYKQVASGNLKNQVLVFGLVFIVAGLAFKLGVVPFHMWVPDVYHGAPTSVTLMIGGAPKLAAFAICMRLLVDGMLPRAKDWQQMLMFLAIASLLVGNFAAIAQANLKRMLAFSTIAQMGFLLLGLLSGVVTENTNGAAAAYSASMFYAITYVLTTLATFGVILLLSREGFESDEISDLAGLNQRSPFYAAIMAICLFSLAGIPPMVGFFAKLSVIQPLIDSRQPMLIALAVYAVIMSLIGAFYYLRIVKVMYFDEPLTAQAPVGSTEVRVVLAINGALVILLGIFPSGLMQLCLQAIIKSLAA